MNSSYNTVEPLRGTISISFGADEIVQDVKKRLTELREGVQMPGFRKGKVPSSLIEKKYGEAVRYEVAEKKAIDALQKSIDENKPNYIAGPLRIDNKIGADGEYEYNFHFALAPNMTIALDKNIKLDFYTVKATEEDVNKEDEAYRMSTRKIADVDSYEDNDHLEGLLQELDDKGQVKEDGLKIDNAYLLPSFFRTEEDKQKFTGAKKGDIIVFNPYNAHEANAAVLAGLFGIEKEKVEEHKGDFQFTVGAIKRHVPEELGEEFYKKIFGEETGIKDESAYREELKKRIEARSEADAKALFRSQLIQILTEKVGQPQLDAETIKAVISSRHMDSSNESKPYTAEELEEQYDLFARYTYYDQMISQLCKKIGVETTREQIEHVLRERIVQDLLRYGYGIDGMETLIDQLVKQRMEDPEKVYEAEAMLREQAIADFAYNEICINPIEVDPSSFVKILDDHYNAKKQAKETPITDREEASSENIEETKSDEKEEPKKKTTTKRNTAKKASPDEGNSVKKSTKKKEDKDTDEKKKSSRKSKKEE